MANIFVVSDTHFGHKGVCEFLNSDNSKLRPWTSVEEMDEALVTNWNSTVGTKDKVYHLGDVVINRKALAILSRLNGEKVLIKGNHDIFKLTDYTAHFKDIRAYHVMDKMILSHIPVHTDSKGRFKANIHGHTHSNRVLDATGSIDEYYQCVCVEQINYTPIAFESIRQKISS